MTSEPPPSESEDTVELGAGRDRDRDRDRPPSLTRFGPSLRDFALVVATGAGVLIGYVIFGDGSTPADPGEANVDHACEMATRIEQTHATTDDWGPAGEDPVYHELSAVAELLTSAALHDQQYTVFAELVRTPLGPTGDFLESSSETIAEVAAACDKR